MASNRLTQLWAAQATNEYAPKSFLPWLHGAFAAAITKHVYLLLSVSTYTYSLYSGKIQKKKYTNKLGAEKKIFNTLKHYSAKNVVCQYTLIYPLNSKDDDV